MSQQEIQIPVKKSRTLETHGYVGESTVMPAIDALKRRRLGSGGNVFLKLVLVAGAAGIVAVLNLVYIHAQVQNETSGLSNSGNPVALSQSLQDLAKQKALTVDSDGQLSLSGQLSLNNGAVLTPSSAPSSPKTGQLYMNQADSQLYYYNGSKFVALANVPDGGVTTDSSGVLSLQGLSGKLALVAGGGVALNGLTISNSGVTRLAAGNGLQLSGATGNVTVSLPQPIGAADMPTFAGLSLVSALGVGSGGTGAASAASARSNLGAASLGANSDITSISGLSTALSVAQGGTGQTSLAATALLVGNDTGGVGLITASSAGKCLISNNAAAPSFQVCPGSVGGAITAGTPQTPGRITKFDTVNNQVVDSLLEENGTTEYIYGDILGFKGVNSAVAFQIQNAGAVSALTVNTSTMTVAVVNLAVSGHIITSGGTPTGVVTSNLGTGGLPSCVISGSDTIGKVTITAGSASTLNGSQCTVTLNSAFGATPHVLLTPTSDLSAQLQPFASMTNGSTFSLGTSVAPTASTSYSYEYFIAQ